MYQGLYKPCDEFLDKNDQLTVINSLHFKKIFSHFQYCSIFQKNQYDFLKRKKKLTCIIKEQKSVL